MKPLTLFLARLLGLFMLVVGCIMLEQKAVMLTAVVSLMLNQPLLMLFGMIAIAAGLAIVLSHNVWSGGVLPVVVTVCGWLLLFKGVALLLVPPEQTASFMARLHYKELFYTYAAIPVALGLYLTLAGFGCPRLRKK